MKTSILFTASFILIFLTVSLQAQRNLSLSNNADGKSYILTIKDAKRLEKLQKEGAEIEAYLGDNQYILKGGKATQSLGKHLNKHHKIQAELSKALDLRTGNKMLEVIIDFYQKPPQLKEWMDSIGGEIIESYYGKTTIIAKIRQGQLKELADREDIKFIAPRPEEVQPMNHEASVVMKARSLYMPNHGELTGKGVVVGIGDGGQLGNHLDFEGRINNKAYGTYSSYGEHGDLVAGCIGGGGHLQPAHKGVAPEATLVIQKTNRILTKAPEYIVEGMTLTNNSYGSPTNCYNVGLYDYTSKMIDEQIYTYPHLLHVFAVGNSGEMACEGTEKGYGTIMKSYAPNKNGVTAGAVTLDKEHYDFSSKGPTPDGRIKPELCAVTEQITSTRRNFNYGSFGGTSSAAAFVTGALALMYDAYENTHSALPENALIKAIACNTATDLGHEGPDYKYGFGVVDVKRAKAVIEEQQHIINIISKEEQKVHELEVPAGLTEAKFLLYWNDLPAEAYPIAALVNDLDLSITDPNGNVIEPWILSADIPNLPATRGQDKINNIEQITIKNPVAGTYTVKVNGNQFPLPQVQSQEYVVTYDYIESGLTVDYPNGHEKWLPNTNNIIAWTLNGTNDSPFKVEYHDGNDWETIQENVPTTKRQITWKTPSNLDKASFKIRVSTNSLSDESNADVILLDAPKVTPEYYCNNIVKVQWNTIPNATAYEVQLFRQDKMLTIGRTTNLEFLIDERLSGGEDYWIAVSAVNGDKVGSYHSATKIRPQAIELCDWSNDVALVEILVSKNKGRAHTSLSVESENELSILIDNRGNNTISNIAMVCLLNGTEIHREICSVSIPSGESFMYTFETFPDIPAGEHQLSIKAVLEEDPTPKNNQSDTILLTQLDNPKRSLPIVYSFENAVNQLYLDSKMALNGLEFIDYERGENARLKVLTDKEGTTTLSFLSDNEKGGFLPKSNLIFTINPLDRIHKTLKMDLEYVFAPENGGDAANQKIWIRGSDEQAWLLLTEIVPMEEWRSLEAIDVSKILKNNHQELSPSFQIKIECNEAVWSIRKLSLYKYSPTDG